MLLVILYITANGNNVEKPPKHFKRKGHRGREITVLDQFNYASWVYNSFALASYCQNKCQPSMEKAHLKDTN